MVQPGERVALDAPQLVVAEDERVQERQVDEGVARQPHNGVVADVTVYTNNNTIIIYMPFSYTAVSY